MALLSASAVMASHDLESLFSEELFELRYENEGEWVHEYLENMLEEAES